jgi:hypothetical protein
MKTDSITFWRLENLHVAMPAKAQSHFLWCEATRSLQNFFFASFSLYIPLLCLVDPRSKSPRSGPSSLPVIPAYTSLPHTTVCHVQNWSLPFTRLGRTHSWLVMAHVHPRWSLQEPVLNMIRVTYQTRGLSVTPRNSLEPLVTPFTVSKPVT